MIYKQTKDIIGKTVKYSLFGYDLIIIFTDNTYIKGVSDEHHSVDTDCELTTHDLKQMGL